MCGILFSAGLESKDALARNALVVDLLNRRGPDSHLGKDVHNLRSLPIHGAALPSVPLTFYSSVLSLRGADIVQQPLQDPTGGAVLCWNGEAWQIDGEPVHGNDTLLVHRGLVDAACRNSADQSSNKSESLFPEDQVASFLASVSGPFAIVFYDPIAARVYFARDCLGRRSLLVKQESDSFTLSSVCDGTSTWSEIEADGIYILHLKGDAFKNSVAHRFPDQVDYFERSKITVSHFPWAAYGKIPSFNKCLQAPDACTLTLSSEPVATLESLLLNSISLRLGGKESAILSTPTVSDLSINEGRVGLHHATKPLGQQVGHSPTTFAILFSGGLDCSVLARIIHDLLPVDHAIDLLNVAFQNPRQQESQNGSLETVFEQCPDRITARKAHAELEKVCPTRKWRLVEIDVPFQEAQAHRDIVLSLMYPHDTEMDRSIALALYFAARGQGKAVSVSGGAKGYYETPARVLFSGLGADELFGGYQRHATAFRINGLSGLLEALDLDITRLGKRNLGRDDRVISHWGREARYPYLDETLVAWAVGAPVWKKCGFGQHGKLDTDNSAISIEPDKQVLRLLALKLEMGGVAREKKRAIQFGARTAKMEGRGKGTSTVTKSRISDG